MSKPAAKTVPVPPTGGAAASTAASASAPLAMPAWANGAIEVGISAGSDKVLEVQRRIPVEAGKSFVVGWSIRRVYLDPSWSPLVKAFVVRAFAWLAHFGLLDFENTFEADPSKFTDAAVLNSHLGYGFSEEWLITLIAATKVNWFMTNHHTGKGQAQGYVAKVLNTFGLMGETGIVDAVWMVGHWAVTHSFLADFGIPNLTIFDPVSGSRVAVNPPGRIILSDDFRLRVSSNPAGTAKLFLAHAIYRRACRNILALFMPSIKTFSPDGASGPGDMAMAKVRVDPAAYHMGAEYLTGKKRIEVDVVPDDEWEALCCFAHAALGGTTLASAPSLMEQAEVSGMDIYVRTVQLKIAIISAKVTGLAPKIAELTGSKFGGLLSDAGYFSKPIEELIKDAEKIVEDEKKAATALALRTGP